MITQTVLVCWNAPEHADEYFAARPHLTRATCHDCQSVVQVHEQEATITRAVCDRLDMAECPRLCIHCTVGRFRLLRPKQDHLAMLGPSRAIAQVNELLGARPA